MDDALAPESLAVRRRVLGVSVLVFVLVAFILYGVPGRGPVEPGPLPTLIALLNAAAACCLVVGYLAIRGGHRRHHQRAMISACVLSGAFLVTYLVHHARVGSMPFQGQGWLRGVYFMLLVPHILLAAAMVPLVLLTLLRARAKRFEAHRRVARWALPVWLYVSVSGVAVYWMLYRM